MKYLIMIFLFISITLSAQSKDLLLLHPRSSGVVNLVTNGTFDTDSDWALATGMSISGGVLNFDCTGYISANQDIGLQAGKTYGYSVDIAVTSGEIQFRYHNGGYILIDNWTTSGNKTGEFTIVGTPNGTLYVRTQVTFVGTADNIVIWEIP